MKLDLGSFAFGSNLLVGGNPSWGTALGQGKGLKFTYPGWDNILAGMMYKSIPTSKVYMPIGKGGHVYNGIEDEGIQLAALFDQVYINEVRVPSSFVMVIYRDSSQSWDGRRTLKYGDKIEYRKSDTEIIRNSDFISAACEALQISEDANWIVSDLYIEDQDTLHMFAGIVNPNGSDSYASGEDRKAAWIEAIQHTISESSLYKRYLSGEAICTQQSAHSLQVIYYGAPGTGKSHEVAKTTKQVEEETKANHEAERVFRTTFHPDSDYSTFVGCYKPTMQPEPQTYVVEGQEKPVVDKDGKQVMKEKIVYNFIPQAFTNAYVRAWLTNKDVYLVIEEINRGNCAQIFGDLFQLLDRDKDGYSKYPIDTDSDLGNHIRKALLASERNDIPEEVKSGKKMQLPSNLYIWATMNTSDQSLFPIDSAFKRRWDWKYMKIKDMKDKIAQPYRIIVKDKQYSWWGFINKMNEHISSTTSSEDKQLGYFFVNREDGQISADDFVNKVLFYLYNDALKDYSVGLNIKNEQGELKAAKFSDFYDDNGEVITEKVQEALDDYIPKEETAPADE